MYFVGLDLAWGRVNPTGIAVLDPRGCLQYIDASITDDDILTALAPYVAGRCLVAIDAPLVVNNPTGRRLAETTLNADFQRFDAGAHPANAGMAVFSGTPRGASLAETLGLDIDPHSTAPRRAIEVYPHPATVALFRLGRTLKYKRGSLSDRRAALLKLVHLIEGLAESPQPMHVTANDNWTRLRETVQRARRPIDLDRAEDPIDAVLCAYIALYATRRPDDITIYGDLTNGYVVTPTVPPDLKPAPRKPASSGAKTGRARVAAETERRVAVTGDNHSPALGGYALGG
jgi:predicted RNase H-like nuclease